MLVECIRALKQQTLPGVDVVVVDNSGRGAARRRLGDSEGVRFVENRANLGFGEAVNRGFRTSQAPFLATINDDAVASPEWLEVLVSAIESDAKAGMCASQVRLLPSSQLDSAGMLVAGDGSSKQRGHGASADLFSRAEEVLIPSGSAALYRREVIEETGGFDGDFFLYCEDTDLGLRARWAGWKCLYVPEALVEHHYSHTTGAVSPQKAYFVERNRLFLALKTFPARMLWKAPFCAVTRYFWHVVLMRRGKGVAARYQKSGGSPLSLVWIVIKAHLAAFAALPSLMAKRRLMKRRIRSSEFASLLQAHRISAREVASL